MADQGDDRRLLVSAQTMAGSLLGLGLVGYFLDRHFQTAPWLLLAGLLLGLTVGLYDLWKAMFPRGK